MLFGMQMSDGNEHGYSISHRVATGGPVPLCLSQILQTIEDLVPPHALIARLIAAIAPVNSRSSALVCARRPAGE